MRFRATSRRDMPKAGDRYSEVTFALFPVRTDDGIVWLERLRVTGVWVYLIDGDSGARTLMKEPREVRPLRKEDHASEARKTEAVGRNLLADAVIMPTHPTVAAVYDTLSRDDWEGLAVLASEGVATRPPSEEILRRLAGIGALTSPEGTVTASGYALLLAWHRRHLRMTWRQRWRATREEIAHFNRMRLLLDDGDGWNVEHRASRN